MAAPCVLSVLPTLKACFCNNVFASPWVFTRRYGRSLSTSSRVFPLPKSIQNGKPYPDDISLRNEESYFLLWISSIMSLTFSTHNNYCCCKSYCNVSAFVVIYSCIWFCTHLAQSKPSQNYVRIWGGQGLEFLYARRTENSLCGRYQEKKFLFPEQPLTLLLPKLTNVYWKQFSGSGLSCLYQGQRTMQMCHASMATFFFSCTGPNVVGTQTNRGSEAQRN